MYPEQQFEQITPVTTANECSVDRPWLVVLSDWPAQERSALPSKIEKAIAKSGCEFPLVFVVVNVIRHDLEHDLLTNLTVAGAMVLEPQTPDELESARVDPRAFAVSQIDLAKQGMGNMASHSVPQPSEPDGYKQFSKPFTKLSPDEFKDLVNQKQPDDWQYEI